MLKTMKWGVSFCPDLNGGFSKILNKTKRMKETLSKNHFGRVRNLSL